MQKFTAQRLQQEKVNTYFQSQSSFWKDIYANNGVYAEIHRERHAIVLDWIDGLTLAPGSQVLEIGCGAGFMSIALAQRGFQVHAIDSVKAMIEQARQHAAESGTTDMLSLDLGDVYTLAFDDGSFDLVIAIGVIPWLEQPELAMQEMARVTRPGGHVILTADNRLRLNRLLDPWLNPALTPLKQRVKGPLERVGLLHRSPDRTETIFHDFHDCRFIDEVLASVGLVKSRAMTLGFGPFSFHRRTVVPEPLGTTLHHQLQRLADQNVPGLRSSGAQYIVLTGKSVARPSEDSTSAELPAFDGTNAL